MMHAFIFPMQDMPRQKNSFDCGVFTCMYANYVSIGKKVDFNQDDMGRFRKQIGCEIYSKKLV